VTLAGQPQNLVSYHMGQLRASGLVGARRSSFDGRDGYYHLDLARCARSLAAAAGRLHPGLRPEPVPPAPPAGRGPDRIGFWLAAIGAASTPASLQEA